MTVRTRLVGTLIVIAAVLAVPALLAAVRLAELRDIAVEERGRHAAAALTLGRMEATVAELDRLQRSYVSTGIPDFRNDARKALARLDDQLVRLRTTRYGDASRVVEPTIATLHRRVEAIEELMEAGELDAAADASNRMEPVVRAMDSGLTELADSVDAIAQRDFDRARAISASAFDATLLAVGIALLLALVIGGWTTGVLTRPLRRLATGTRDVADGSFTPPRDLPYAREDEIGELSRAFRRMTFRLEDLDRMKSEFVGIASHELKNPMNVVRGYAELLSEEIPGPLNEKQHEMVAAVSEQTTIMEGLMRRLMDISRLESGTYELRVGTVRTEELLATLERSFEVLAAEKGEELVFDLTESAPETFAADEALLRDEVLGNLVSNAIAHTPEGGRVTVRAGGGDGRVVFEVSDTGPGIPRAERARIFERYFQAGRSAGGGAGLGLAVAREMVEAHRGRLELDPDAAPGATFRVTLPVDATDVRDPVIRRRGG